MGKLDDLTGKSFGCWVVLNREENDSYNHTKWFCKCSCGTEKTVYGASLRSGKTISCGCQRDKDTSERRTTHGKSRNPEYAVWYAMIQRCNNSNSKDYKDYGKRGISVCSEWEDYTTFIRDMGERPSSKHSLDRINNELGYSPDNCRWVTQDVQTQNQRIRKNNTSGYRGISWCNNKWKATIHADKHRVYLGKFDNIEEAIKVRKDAELKYWGKSS